MDLNEFQKKLMDEDPDFGKIFNSEPEKELAFNIVEAPRLYECLDLGKCRQFQFVDDYWNPVSQVPIGQTSRTMFLDFAVDISLVLNSLPEQSSPEVMLHMLARGILEDLYHNPEADLLYTLSEAKNLRVSRFYYRFSKGQDRWHPIILTDEEYDELRDG